jgi:molybdopterin-containing oxidoreductase family membrane subunit
MQSYTLNVRAKNNSHIILALMICAVGLYGMINVFFHGQEHSYGVSREVPLGLLLIGYAFFVGVSVGLSVIAVLSHVFKFEAYHFRSKHIALLSFASLIGAFFLIFWELGGPYSLQVLRFIKYYANFELTSPIWWMSTFYLFETPLLALELYLLIKGDKKAIFWAGVVGFILGILAYSTLSMVFAVNVAKPIWHSAQMTISFILGALICGGGVSILLMLFRSSEEPNREETINAISKMMFFLLIASAFIHVWTGIITSYGAGLLAESLKALASSPIGFYHAFFELIVGIVIPMALLILGKFKSLKISSLASICAIIGVFFNRYDQVIGGQLIKVESTFLPNLEMLTYTPSLSEISILISGIGVVMFIYELGHRFLPINGGEIQ